MRFTIAAPSGTASSTRTATCPAPRCGAHDGFHVPEDYSAVLDLCDPDPPSVPIIELAKVMVSGEDSLRGPTVRQGPRQRVSLDQAHRLLAQGEYDIYVNGRRVACWSEAGRVFRPASAT